MQNAIQIQNEDTIVSTVHELCEAASGVIIISRQDLSEATDLVKIIKVRAKEIETERTSLVKPINDTVDKINARFKVISAPLKAAEDEIKGKMLAFQQEEARKAEVLRKEAERKAAEEAARLALEAPQGIPSPIIPVAVQQPAKTVYGQMGSVSTMKKVWVYELEDIQALAAARPDLVMLDGGKINAEIRGKGGVIPGLRIFEKETIAVR